MLVHLHGGHFRTGRRGLEARPLLHVFARRGWVVVSADYRLHPRAVFPDFLVDVKRVIAWVRANAREFGGDPDHIVLAGSSAGAHLALTAAFTPNEARFQPGFEPVDTAVSGAIGLYGYYGQVDRHRQRLPSSPADYAGPGAPPVLVIHGDRDGYVPAAHARAFVDGIRGAGCDPVAYAELPGAGHAFDLFRSVRFMLVIDGIAAFAEHVLRRDGRRTITRGARRRSPRP